MFWDDGGWSSIKEYMLWARTEVGIGMRQEASQFILNQWMEFRQLGIKPGGKVYNR